MYYSVFKTHINKHLFRTAFDCNSQIYRQNLPGLLITSQWKVTLDAKQRDIIAQVYHMTAENLNTRQFSGWEIFIQGVKRHHIGGSTTLIPSLGMKLINTH